MTKRTSALRAFDMIKTLPVGSSFSINDIMTKMPDYVTKSAVGNLVWNMKKLGFLTKIPGTWQYGVIAKTRTYDKHHVFHSKYASRGDKTSSPKRQRTSARKVVGHSSDFDIIENLLDAMAQAEPILRRYEKLDKFVQTFNDLSNVK